MGNALFIFLLFIVAGLATLFLSYAYYLFSKAKTEKSFAVKMRDEMGVKLGQDWKEVELTEAQVHELETKGSVKVPGLDVPLYKENRV